MTNTDLIAETSFWQGFHEAIEVAAELFDNKTAGEVITAFGVENASEIRKIHGTVQGGKLWLPLSTALTLCRQTFSTSRPMIVYAEALGSKFLIRFVRLQYGPPMEGFTQDAWQFTQDGANWSQNRLWSMEEIATGKARLLRPDDAKAALAGAE